MEKTTRQKLAERDALIAALAAARVNYCVARDAAVHALEGHGHDPDYDELDREFVASLVAWNAARDALRRSLSA